MRPASRTIFAPVFRNSATWVAFSYVLCLGITLGLVLRHGGSVKDAGWTWAPTPEGYVVETISNPGPAQTLRKGALLLAINGDTRAALHGPRPWLQRVRTGDKYKVTWAVPGDSATQDAILTMGGRPAPGDLAMQLCDILISIAFAAGGILIWAARPGDKSASLCRQAALGFAGYLLGSALGPVSLQLSGFGIPLYVFLRMVFPLYVVKGVEFFAYFPSGEVPHRLWRPAITGLWILGTLVWCITLPSRLLPFLGIESRIVSLSGLDLLTRPELQRVAIRHGFFLLCTIAVVVALVQNYRRVTSAANRLRVRWVVVGSAIGMACPLLASLTLTLAGTTHVLTTAQVQTLVQYYSLSTLSMLAIPATITYAVVCHRLMGLRVAVFSGMQILAARRVLRVATLLPLLFAVRWIFLHRQESAGTWLSSHPAAVWMIAAATLITTFRSEFLDVADRVLLRHPYNRDELVRGLLEILLEKPSSEAIARTVALRMDTALHPECILYYRVPPSLSAEPQFVCGIERGRRAGALRPAGLVSVAGSRGSVIVDDRVLAGLPESERQWLDDEQIALAVPVVGDAAGRPVGLFLLGHRRSGERYCATDIDVLEELCRQVYLALKLRELEHAMKQAVSERNAANAMGQNKAQFLAQVSHELRNPLQGVVGLAGLLLNTPLSEEQQEYAELIRRSSEWIVTIANDLLDLSRLDAGKLKLDSVEFEWLGLLEDLTSIAAGRARGKAVDVALHFDPRMPSTGVGDPTRIRQILLNLLDNAVKFTERGWVVMRVSPLPAGAVRIEVEDTGPGIPDDLAERVFLPYEQAAASAKREGGSGLGLAISKRLSEAMQADLVFETRKGRGSRFRLTLPPRAFVPETLPADRRPLDGVRVLHIDSNPITSQATSLALTALGADIATRSWENRGNSGPCSFDVVVAKVSGASHHAVMSAREIRRSEGMVPLVILHNDQAPLSPEELRVLSFVSQLRLPASRNSLLRAIEQARQGAPISSPARRQADPVLDIDASCAGTRLLVVEDDPSNARAVRRMLETMGCIVRVAAGGTEALDTLQTEAFDLILLDGQMPGMDGIELTGLIRKLEGPSGQTPIVAMTGYTAPEVVDAFFAAGADDYLPKPVNVTELRNVIRLQAGGIHSPI